MSDDLTWHKYVKRFKTLSRLIQSPGHHLTEIIVCIPVYAEPDIIRTLESLIKCNHHGMSIEVIILFNHNDLMNAQEKIIHQHSFEEVHKWIQLHLSEWMTMHPVFMKEMPDARGGVGWARKLAMDEAAQRLSDDGIIVNLDADCIVSDNYFEEIKKQFAIHPAMHAASIYFEHAYEDLSIVDREAIIEYELHLRYLVHAQKWCRHPYSYYTVGSAMAVRRNTYLQNGGMNTRSAGEDFYFLQKFIETDRFFEIRNTTVFPSSRISLRVPFGTGKAMHRIKQENKNWRTINFEIFRMIAPLFDNIELIRNTITLKNDQEMLPMIVDLNTNVRDYLVETNFINEVRLIAAQTTTIEAFKKRFYRYFNSFRLMKYTHVMRDRFYPDIAVTNAVHAMLNELTNNATSTPLTAIEYLELLRHSDKTGEQVKPFV